MQFVINFTAYFSIIFLFSVAFFFQYRIFRVFDLSLGASFLIGGYGFLGLIQAGQSIAVSIVWGTLLAITLGYFLLVVLVRPLTHYQASALDITLCALGIYIVGVNVFAMVFGDELQRPVGLWLSRSIVFGDGFISGAQLCAIILALLTYIIIAVAMRYTTFGRIFRALSDSPNLARDLGLPTGSVTAVATMVGAALVGITGLLVAIDVGIRPTTAFQFVIPALAAVLAFGGPSVTGLIVGAATVALAGELGGFAFGQQWRELSIFTIIGIFLAIRARVRPVSSR